MLAVQVRCVCGAEDDDGEAMTECDGCSTWQHNACVGLPAEGPDSDTWLCAACFQSGEFACRRDPSPPPSHACPLAPLQPTPDPACALTFVLAIISRCAAFVIFVVIYLSVCRSWLRNYRHRPMHT